MCFPPPTTTTTTIAAPVPAGNASWHDAVRTLAYAPVTLIPLGPEASPPYVLFSLSDYVPTSPGRRAASGAPVDTDDRWASLSPVQTGPELPWSYGWHIGFTLSSPGAAHPAWRGKCTPVPASGTVSVAGWLNG